MAVLLDILGAILLCSLLLLNVMRMNVGLSDYAILKTFTYGTQSDATSITSIIEDDLRKAGLGVAGASFLQADSTQIRFLADLGMNGAIDTVHYYAGDPAEAIAAVNPGYRFLYRDLNGEGAQVVGGVTDFSFSYFGAAGDSLALPVTLAEVRQVRVNLWVESAAPQDTSYAKSVMQVSVIPKNL